MSGMTDEMRVIEDLRSLVEFAYEKGFHEMGYDPVATVEARLRGDGEQGQAVACEGCRNALTGYCDRCAAELDRPHPVAGDAVRALLDASKRVATHARRESRQIDADWDHLRNVIRETEAALSTQPAPSAPAYTAEPLESESIAKGVQHCIEQGDGFWAPCSGCYETLEGHPVGGYAYSHTFGCTLGGGCHECGGLGAVWDNADYAAMAEEIEATGAPAPSEQVAASVAVPEGWREFIADCAANRAYDTHARCERAIALLAAAPVAPEREVR